MIFEGIAWIPWSGEICFNLLAGQEGSQDGESVFIGPSQAGGRGSGTGRAVL